MRDCAALFVRFLATENGHKGAQFSQKISVTNSSADSWDLEPWFPEILEASKCHFTVLLRLTTAASSISTETGSMNLTTTSDEAQSSAATTSFLLSNLHCPSCVANIENVLGGLTPKPTLVQASVVTSWVTVAHDRDLTSTSMQSALEEAGFDVCSICENGVTRDVSERLQSPDILDDVGALDELCSENKYFGLGRPNGHDDLERMRWRHVQDCELCRTTGYQNTKTNKMLSPATSQQPLIPSDADETSGIVIKPQQSPPEQPLVVVDDGEQPQDLWRASLAIGGMTCAACANAITSELKERAWVRDVSVNLLSNSATVEVVGKQHVEELKPAIEDLGYEAVLTNAAELSTPKRDMWRAGIAIEGMTCASCSNAITNALEKKDWVDNAAVNFITNSATVDFTGKDHAYEIVDSIEDLGYGATLDDVTDLAEIAKDTRVRTVDIMVSDMFCTNCPANVMRALEDLEPVIRIDSPLTLENTTMRLSYEPHSPEFTIREILKTISDLHSGFHVSIYHPPSLEERSRALHEQQQRRLLLRVVFTIFIAIPTLIVGIILMSLISSSNPARKWVMRPWTAGVSRAQWILLILSTPVYFLAADVFHRRAFKEIHSLWRRGNKTPILQRFYRFGSMSMLMSLGTSIAYWSSVAQLISAGVTQPKEVDDRVFYFDSVVFLTMFLLIGRWIEAYSKSRTGDAVTLLGKLRPTEAILVDARSGQNIQVDVDLIDFGDTVRVLHGASPPCDGTISEGETVFDESSLTGESKLVKKVVGSEVYSGTVNKGAPISITITGVAGNSMLDQIVTAVREGQTRRAPIERIADLLTAYFVPAITFLAIITWVIWLSLGVSGKLPRDYMDVRGGQGGWVAWSLQFAIAVFVVACPCGLALAAPTAVFVGGGLAAQYGILVKGGGEAFEKASKVDCIVFDKTGTLTMGGQPAVTEYFPIPTAVNQTLTERNILAMISQVESNSTHTVAKAIVDFCCMENTEKYTVTNVEEIPGRGMRAHAIYNDSVAELLIGNEALMYESSVEVSEVAQRLLGSWGREGKSVVLVGLSGNMPNSDASDAPEDQRKHLVALFAISDPIRPEAPAIVRDLQKRGTDVWMISGDNAVTAHAIGLTVGILPANIIAGVLPSQKAERLHDLQRSLATERHESRRGLVAMIGDGINDSPALAAADVGIAIGSGSDIAISTAEFVLVRSDLAALSTLIDLSRVVFRRVRFNFGWALVYNVVAVPVAAGVFFALKTKSGEHVRLDPVWASLAMALSSISVVCSSLALRFSAVPWIGFRERKLERD